VGVGKISPQGKEQGRWGCETLRVAATRSGALPLALLATLIRFEIRTLTLKKEHKLHMKANKCFFFFFIDEVTSLKIHTQVRNFMFKFR